MSHHHVTTHVTVRFMSWQQFSEEEKKKLGVLVKPKKGRAVLWWNRKKDGSVDWRSRHVGCPLISGEKWSATRWMHYHDPSSEASYAHDNGNLARLQAMAEGL